LFAVTTDAPFSIAFFTSVNAGSTPPITSTSTSGAALPDDVGRIAGAAATGLMSVAISR
jgi:hypothetical protein